MIENNKEEIKNIEEQQEVEDVEDVDCDLIICSSADSILRKKINDLKKEYNVKN